MGGSLEMVLARVHPHPYPPPSRGREEKGTRVFSAKNRAEHYCSSLPEGEGIVPHLAAVSGFFNPNRS
jgi:hypothetical protein